MADQGFHVDHRPVLFGTPVVNYKRNLATPPNSLGLVHRQVFFTQGATNYKRNLAGAARSFAFRSEVLPATQAIKVPSHGRIFLGTVLVDVVFQPRLPGDTGAEIAYNIPGRLRFRPHLIAPANQSQHRIGSPVMIWTPTVEAEYYEVHIATDIQFQHRVARFNSFDIQLQRGFEFGATYYWRVRAVAGSRYSDYSEVWSFSVPPLLPSPVISHSDDGGYLLLNQFRKDA